MAESEFDCSVRGVQETKLFCRKAAWSADLVGYRSCRERQERREVTSAPGQDPSAPCQLYMPGLVVGRDMQILFGCLVKKRK